MADDSPTQEMLFLDPVVSRRLIRWMVVGIVFFLACSLARVGLPAFLVAAYFLILCFFRRLDPVNLLIFVLAMEPFLGPYRGYSSFHLDWALFVCAVISLWSAAGPHKRFISNQLDLTLCCFIGACWVAAALSFMYRELFRVWLDSLVIPFGYYVVAKNCVQREDLLPKLYLAVVVAILALGAFGVVEAFTKQDLLSYGEKVPDPFRINGPFRRDEDFGVCMTILLLFYFAMKSLWSDSRFRPLISRLVSLLGIVSVYFTLMRGLWLGLGAGWLVQVCRRNIRLALLIVPALGIVVLVFFKVILPQIAGDVWEKRVQNEQTINARLATYKSALAMFVDHPFFGVGFAAFGEAVERNPERYQLEYKGEPSVESPHNNFLCLLSETGAVGFITFVLFLAQAFRTSARVGKYARNPIQREYALFVFSAVAAYVVTGMGLHIIRNTLFINKYLFIFLGILSGMMDSIYQAGVSSNAAPEEANPRAIREGKV